MMMMLLMTCIKVGARWCQDCFVSRTVTPQWPPLSNHLSFLTRVCAHLCPLEDWPCPSEADGLLGADELALSSFLTLLCAFLSAFNLLMSRCFILGMDGLLSLTCTSLLLSTYTSVLILNQSVSCSSLRSPNLKHSALLTLFSNNRHTGVAYQTSSHL